MHDFLQILKPVTRKKLRIEGNMYHRVLSEYLQALPLYLGGNCACKICTNVSIHVMQQPQTVNMISNVEPGDHVSDDEDMSSLCTNVIPNDNWDHKLRTAVIGILMAWVFVALIAGFYDW
uniref:Uncharacterized protein n=1 Tax=Rhizophora mucronata TaxID=61149 RepID=A0A2P2K3P1_RHIMU